MDFQFKKKLPACNTVLSNVINVDEVQRRANETVTNDIFDLCYVGRLTFQKNPERLMEICLQLIDKKHDAKIAIIGTGELSSYVENFISQNGVSDNIKYYGFLSNPLPFIKQSNVLILTSRYEGTPIVALEALSLGTPVISTKVDGLIDVIQSGYNGFLCDNNEDFINAINTITGSKKDFYRNNCINWANENCNIEKYKTIIKSSYVSCIVK